jgi:hypothetical protein
VARYVELQERLQTGDRDLRERQQLPLCFARVCSDASWLIGWHHGYNTVAVVGKDAPETGE